MQSEILLRTIDENASKPSFFELTIMDKMEAMIKPAIRHIILNVAEVFQYNTLVERFEDIYTFIMLGLQWNSLYRGDASIIETIYGLRRLDTTIQNKTISPLQKKQRMLSLAIMVVAPRIMTMLRDLATRINQRRNSSSGEVVAVEVNQGIAAAGAVHVLDTSVFSSTMTALNRAAELFQFAFATAFPYIELGWDCTVILQRILYMCGRSEHHHPLFTLLGMTLMKRSSILDDSKDSTVTSTGTSNSITGVLSRNWPVTIVLALVLAVRTAEYLQINQQSLATSSLTNRISLPAPLPPAPRAGRVGRSGCVPPLDVTLCAVCNKKRTNPCASTSGYVMCYMCLLKHVREKGTCPVTGQVCRESDIVRLFEEEETTP